MTIVSVGPAPPWRGGIAHYHYGLVQELRAQAVDVEVLTFARLYPRLLFPGTSAADRAEGAFPPLGEAILRPLASWSWRRGARWIRQRRPEAVLFHWWHPFFALAYLGVLKRIGGDAPVGFICHNVASHEGMPLGGRLTEKVLRQGDFFIAGGEEMAEQIGHLNRRGLVEVVLHPQYDLPYTQQPPPPEEARRRLGLDREGPVFLFFGLVREYKGLDVLLDALSMLPPQAPWTCVVAGEFYQSRKPYEARIAELGLGERIRLEDRYIPNSEVPLYFAAADLTVLPYRHATQSGVAALSFAFHRPVLTTRVGALPEMIAEGENGWLVPPGDPQALASRMAEVVYDPQTARLPVVEGSSGLPGWQELARTVRRLAAAAAEQPRP